MRLFKTEMLFLQPAAPALRPRYGGRGSRLRRELAASPHRSASICILNPADPEACACRLRSAAWLPSCDMDRAA
jgi:hypothetical protein